MRSTHSVPPRNVSKNEGDSEGNQSEAYVTGNVQPPAKRGIWNTERDQHAADSECDQQRRPYRNNEPR